MKITRDRLGQIIREEVVRMIREADKDEPGAELADAEQDSKGKKDAKPAEKKPAPPAPKKSPGAHKKDAGDPAAAGGGNVLPAEEEPADDELEQDVADPAATEDESEVTGGKIANTVTGKTIQSMSMEPKSKIVPGAKEMVITFDQITDPLRVIITKQGEVKFYFRGLHNEL